MERLRSPLVLWIIMALLASGCTLDADLEDLLSKREVEDLPLGTFPIDKITPLFQDDFNRSDEPLISNTKWMSSPLGESFLINQELNVAENSGLVVAAPNNPVAFADLAKTYIETSVRMDGSQDQVFYLLPYFKAATSEMIGCFFQYSGGTFKVIVGSAANLATPSFELSGYPWLAVNYVGCEVDQSTGVVSAYLNSVKLAERSQVSVPAAADSVPVIVGGGNGMVFDDVKAFASFHEGREERSGDLRIYNAPFVGYYDNELAAFSLQGYCSENGATVQVKDVSGEFQAPSVVCGDNRFVIPLDLTSGTRFKYGINQLRIEYTMAAGTQEHLWYFYRKDGVFPASRILASFTKPSDMVLEGNSASTQQIEVVLNQPAAVDVTVKYALSGVSSTAQNPAHHNLPATGTLVIPKGQKSGMIQYTYKGDAAAGGSKILQVAIVDLSGPGLRTRMGKYQIIRRFVRDEESPSVVQISAGFAQSCMLFDNGQLKCWGTNAAGQLGDGTLIDRTAPSLVAGGGLYSYVSVGQDHTCAVLLSGDLQCWGQNLGGKLGDGTGTNRLVPTAVNDTAKYTMVASSISHTCAVTTAGAVKCWGSTFGYSPTLVSGAETYSMVTAGQYHSCGITTGGFVRCWGENGTSQLGDGTSTDRITPTPLLDADRYSVVTAGKDFTCGITEAGKAKCWGNGGNLGAGGRPDSATPIEVSGGDLYDRISANWQYTCGIGRQDKRIRCWGYDQGGNLGKENSPTAVQVPTLTSDEDQYAFIATGPQVGCGITVAGVPKCWGRNINYNRGDSFRALTPQRVLTSEKFKSVWAGRDTTCGVSTQGKAYCWGSNVFNQIGDGLTSNRGAPVAVEGADTYKAVATSQYHSCGLLENGLAKCWGASTGDGLIGDGTSTTRYKPVPVKDNHLFASLEVGNSHSCGVDSQGYIRCWGANYMGQLGIGSLSSQNGPAVVGAELYQQVSAGGIHTCALNTAGKAYCWGGNTAGQLGDGTAGLGTHKTVPTAVSGSDDFKVVSSGGFHTCGITTADLVKCWGQNSIGELGDGTLIGRYVPTAIVGATTYKMIDAGYSHTCAITVAGTVQCWGSNTHGQLGNGTNINSSSPVDISDGARYKMISAGHTYTCGVTEADELKCWGGNANFEADLDKLGLGSSPVNSTARPVTAP
nr:hypothetical protein HAGR004_22400 [Bdellovibrio sp. HAGR004]